MEDNKDGTNRTVYSRESNSTGWFVGIIVALALLAIAYLVFSANSQPAAIDSFKAAIGATVISYDKNGVVLKQTDGSCGLLSYVGRTEDYSQITCPASAPAAPVASSAPAADTSASSASKS